MSAATPTVAVVLAGGTGTRLYPASRSTRPKQFLALDGERTLLERTVARAGFADETYVLTPARFADRVRELVPDAGVLVEPAAKDTGPAVTYATHRVREQVGACTLCVLPSDHRVEGADGFAATARRAAAAAAATGALVTVGVEPTRPETGYGYLDPGPWRAVPDRVGSGDEDGCGGRGEAYAPVAAFHEKPDRETAADLVASGWLWNAGVFAWTATAFLEAARDSPLAPLVAALADGRPGDGYAAVEAVSVDEAVLERHGDVATVAADFAWDDLGTWDAFDRHATGENAVVDRAALLARDATGNVVATDGAHVSLVGVADLVVAAYDDRVLVVPKSEAQRVREVVTELDADERF